MIACPSNDNDNDNDNEEDKVNKDKGLIIIWCIVAWVTRPERPKGVKDEVKQARRAKSGPAGP